MTLGFEEDHYEKPKLLSDHKIRQGDVVTLDQFDIHYVKKHDHGFRGIVKQAKRFEIQVMLYSKVDYIPSDLTHLCSVMLENLAKLFLDEKFSSLSTLASTFKNIEYLDDRLNEYQRNAVQFALVSPEIALIHDSPEASQVI
ncbi:uncharacterized protein B0P05DRAFT_588239 [Gilbertella persicaria]|uniref:uncharacterized protein n=1 Tax=Gilbertella persicaria TaxID=101096 RepID=UPI002220FB7F|nr:uncharacterized protein B0P05DRAFT_588239 [Gilbertella persicaria]KAI8075817.1 hypothetical protein B0P05DRAFT_588239 [Gilbertella persicaria]